MTVYVAYNAYGGLIADAYTYASLLRRIRAAGYDESEVRIGRATA